MPRRGRLGGVVRLHLLGTRAGDSPMYDVRHRRRTAGGPAAAAGRAAPACAAVRSWSSRCCPPGRPSSCRPVTTESMRHAEDGRRRSSLGRAAALVGRRRGGGGLGRRLDGRRMAHPRRLGRRGRRLGSGGGGGGRRGRRLDHLQLHRSGPRRPSVRWGSHRSQRHGQTQPRRANAIHQRPPRPVQPDDQCRSPAASCCPRAREAPPVGGHGRSRR